MELSPDTRLAIYLRERDLKELEARRNGLQLELDGYLEQIVELQRELKRLNEEG